MKTASIQSSPVSRALRWCACSVIVTSLGLLTHRLVETHPATLVSAQPLASNGASAAVNPPTPSQAVVQRLKAEGSYASLQAAYQAARAAVEPVSHVPAEIKPAAFHADTPWRGLHTFFSRDGIQMRSSSADASQVWQWDARLASYGYVGAEQAPAEATLVAHDNGLDYQRGAITEWYLNDTRGLEQGFTLAAPPARSSSNHPDAQLLAINLAYDTNLKPTLNAAADSVSFAGENDAPVLHYDKLLAWDASGRSLPAHIELRSGHELALLIDDRSATYPVTIDPIIYAETELIPGDGTGGDLFGYSVAFDAGTLVVGSPRSSSDRGTAYVFVQTGGAWAFQAKLAHAGSTPLARIANVVAISGDTIILGMDTKISSPRAAYVFVRNGTTWTEQQPLTTPDQAYDNFAAAVAVSGNTAVVGAPEHNSDGTTDHAGAAYVFVRNGEIWTEQQKLISTVPALQRFGGNLALEGDMLVTTADGVGEVFTRSNGVWTQQPQILKGSDFVVGSNDNFLRVSMAKGSLIFGALSGGNVASYVFTLDNGQWIQQAKLVPPGVNTLAVISVALSGDIAVLGDSTDSEKGIGAGAIHVFARSNNIWSYQQKLTLANGAPGDAFGASVAAGPGIVVGGAPYKETAFGPYGGAVHTYTAPALAASADLLVSVGADNLNPRQGDTVTYTMTVQNYGPNTATNVIVDDLLSSGTTFVSAKANKGTFTTPVVGQTGTLSWKLGDLVNATKESAQIQVTVVIKGKDTITSTATVHSDATDPNPANNTATLTLSVATTGKGGKK